MTTEKPSVSAKPNIGPRSPIKHNFENPILPNPNSQYEDVQFTQNVSPQPGKAKSPLEKKMFKKILPDFSVNTILGKKNALNSAGINRRPSASFAKFEPPGLQVKQDDENQPDRPETPTSQAGSPLSPTSPQATSPSPTSPNSSSSTNGQVAAPAIKPKPQMRSGQEPPQNKPAQKLPPRNQAPPQNKPSPPLSKAPQSIPQNKTLFRDQTLPSKVNLPSGVLILQPFKAPSVEPPESPKRISEMVTRKTEVLGQPEKIYDNNTKMNGAARNSTQEMYEEVAYTKKPISPTRPVSSVIYDDTG